MQIAKSSTSTDNVQPLPPTWIDALMDKMLLSYGKKFLDQWAGVDTEKLYRHWANELGGFTRDELARGAAAMAAQTYPPTLPEFKKMCRPGIDPSAAYQEAVAGVNARERGELGDWSHPAIFWASSCMAYDLKHQAYQSIAKRWETALQAEMSKGEWSAIPQPMIALPAPGKSLSSRQQATQMLQEIGASDVLKARTDHRAWIPAVLKRAERGDETLPGISLRFAREALAAREAN